MADGRKQNWTQQNQSRYTFLCPGNRTEISLSIKFDPERKIRATYCALQALTQANSHSHTLTAAIISAALLLADMVNPINDAGSPDTIFFFALSSRLFAI
jgi:hypothetical protein